MNRHCEKLEPLNPRAERDTAPVEDGNDAGFHRQARRPRVEGAQMMTPEGADRLEGWMKDAIPVSFYGD
jgi:hypothetical protein